MPRILSPKTLESNARNTRSQSPLLPECYFIDNRFEVLGLSDSEYGVVWTIHLTLNALAEKYVHLF
jgi:hypothetical protein